MNTLKLPEHIGGYQHLEPDVITTAGDILVVDGKPIGFSPIGFSVASVEHIDQARVYRKYPCPRQGGDRALTEDERRIRNAQIARQQPEDHQMSDYDRKPGVIAARAMGCNVPPGGVANCPLPSDAKARKGIPIATGFVDYFPKAIAAVARLSQIGNDQHNPGSPLHWDRSKSGDEADAQMRHFIDRGKLDADGVPHDVKNAWRAMAGLEKYLERNPWL